MIDGRSNKTCLTMPRFVLLNIMYGNLNTNKFMATLFVKLLFNKKVILIEKLFEAIYISVIQLYKNNYIYLESK